MDAPKCLFCAIPGGQVLIEHPLVLAKRDGYPISKGHTLIIPRRHVVSFFDTTEEERLAMLKLLDEVKSLLDREHKPDGYNIGINNGPAAGQTVMHLHMHLIPRYAGDRPDPRGGGCGGSFRTRRRIGRQENEPPSRREKQSDRIHRIQPSGLVTHRPSLNTALRRRTRYE